jgi:phosphodiesterase/alkaline phosphatase D-like protein
MTLNRREFVQLAAAMGASLAWGGSARASTTGWHERRDLYPEGVASGDPDPSSVILLRMSARRDDSGLGIEPNNLKAINSLIAYRSLRYGRHLDLILTDQHSFCGDDPTDAEGVGKIYDPAFNGMFSEPAMIALDAGRTFNGGKPLIAPAAMLAVGTALAVRRGTSIGG